MRSELLLKRFDRCIVDGLLVGEVVRDLQVGGAASLLGSEVLIVGGLLRDLRGGFAFCVRAVRRFYVHINTQTNHSRHNSNPLPHGRGQRAEEGKDGDQKSWHQLISPR
jgi:hypothetical protein